MTTKKAKIKYIIEVKNFLNQTVICTEPLKDYHAIDYLKTHKIENFELTPIEKYSKKILDLQSLLKRKSD